MTGTVLDLGHGHLLTFIGWHPDDLPANRERYGVPLPSVDRAGANVHHPRKDGPGECDAFIQFDLPATQAAFAGQPLWTVQSWEPLTLSPSLLCTECGDHGFIREGRWVPA